MKTAIQIMIAVLIFSNTLIHAQIMRIKTESGDKEYKIDDIDTFYFLEEKKYSEIKSLTSMNFGTLSCYPLSKDTVITIKNVGNQILAITHIDIYPKENFDFAVPPDIVFGLSPGEEYDISLRYEPKSFAAHEEKLRITSNAKSGAYYDISLTGKKEDSDYSFHIDTIDFGLCCEMRQRDTLVNVLNNATTRNSIYVKECPNAISLDTYEFELLEIKKLHISLNPEYLTNPNDYSDFILFRDQCGKEKELIVKWKIPSPELVINDVEFQSDLTSVAIKDLEIENKSSEEFVMTSYEFDNNCFSFENVNLPYTIPANSTAKLEVKFSPKGNTTEAGKLTIKSYCNYSKEVKLTGKVKIYLIKDGFEWYLDGSFPYSGDWNMNNYKAPPDSQKVTSDISYSGEKCIRGWGVWGMTPSMNSVIYHDLSEQPDEIYCECAAMIDRIGVIHVGLGSSYNDIFTSYCSVDFSNHAHFFYCLGTGGAMKEGRWENDHYAPEIWYKIKFKLDYPKKEMTIWIDDTLVKTDSVNTFPTNRYQYFYMRTSGGYGDEGSGYYDDVKVWYLSE